MRSWEEVIANPAIVTEPFGAAGIRYVSLQLKREEEEALRAWHGKNPPPPIVERTVINRSEAMMMLQGTEFDLTIPPKLEADIRSGRTPTILHDDPYLKLSPQVSFDYMTEPTFKPKSAKVTPWGEVGQVALKTDPKTGEKKILGAHFANFALGSVSFFSETSKMSAPSWSLPAGPQSEDGTCASADINKPSRAYPYRKAMEQPGEFDRGAPIAKHWICAYCYAGKSNYMHRTSQYSQTARNIWLLGSLEHRGIEETARIMADALAAHLANEKVRAKLGEATDYFRIHDSGDFTPDSYEMWTLICIDKRLKDVHFWVPTRMWVYPAFNELVRRNPAPRNMTMRPSALHFNNPAPRLIGYAPGSTAHMDLDVMVPGKRPGTMKKGRKIADAIQMGIASWECPAYKNDAHSCAGAGGPKGEKDCRFCWNYRGPQDTVSYRAH
jgi:hypothetical protein